jgi:hypothetical protein
VVVLADVDVVVADLALLAVDLLGEEVEGARVGAGAVQGVISGPATRRGGRAVDVTPGVTVGALVPDLVACSTVRQSTGEVGLTTSDRASLATWTKS